MQFSGKTILITGASRGIGAAALSAFHAAGANVVGLARSQEALEAQVTPLGDRAMACVCDIADQTAVQHAVDQAVARFGGIDVVINNAAMLDPIGYIGEIEPAAWAHLIHVNLSAQYGVIHATLPQIKARQGTVINISSGAAYGYYEGWSAYCASKAGLLILTQGLHAEQGAHGVRALGLSPGTVATHMQRQISASGIGPVAQMDWEDHNDPHHTAGVLMWMCTPQADGYLGQDVKFRDLDLSKVLGNL